MNFNHGRFQSNRYRLKNRSPCQSKNLFKWRSNFDRQSLSRVMKQAPAARISPCGRMRFNDSPYKLTKLDRDSPKRKLDFSPFVNASSESTSSADTSSKVIGIKTAVKRNTEKIIGKYKLEIPNKAVCSSKRPVQASNAEVPSSSNYVTVSKYKLKQTSPKRNQGPHLLKRTITNHSGWSPSSAVPFSSSPKKYASNSRTKLPPSPVKFSPDKKNISTSNFRSSTILCANHMVKKSISNLVKSKYRNKLLPCMFYSRFGTCKKYASGICQFSHDRSMVLICPSFLAKECLLGDACKLSHDKSNGRLPTCKFFAKGKCTNKKCPYAHSKHPVIVSSKKPYSRSPKTKKSPKKVSDEVEKPKQGNDSLKGTGRYFEVEPEENPVQIYAPRVLPKKLQEDISKNEKAKSILHDLDDSKYDSETIARRKRLLVALERFKKRVNEVKKEGENNDPPSFILL